MDALYILTRSSGRAEFFRRCRESVKALAYPGPIVHIVHVDDPRDAYVEGDIIVQGEAHGPNMGSAPYNLYQNRLLAAIPPEDGWVHFIDDDDYYVGSDVFDWLVGADPGKMHVVKVERWDGIVFPKNWKKQRSFQTECFVARRALAKTAKWWSDKGGDHHYSKKLVQRASLEWHDIKVVAAQEGKGHGRRVDVGGVEPDYHGSIADDEIVSVKMFSGSRGGRLVERPYAEALEIERAGQGRVTFRGVTVC